MVVLRKIGPKTEGHQSIGMRCPACEEDFAEGDFTTLISLGPGSDPEARKRCRDGRPYNAVAKEVHWACATGNEE
jgi:hypothetical protein